MRAKEHIKRIVERLAGAHIYPDWAIPRGWDLFRDIASDLPRLPIRVVFDVGANAGQSAIKFLSGFPAATIYSFEPSDITFRKLESALRCHRRVQAIQLALGASSGEARLVHEGTSMMFRLLDDTEDAQPSTIEQVKLSTVDDFCRQRGIERIDFLKVDTEGRDLEVLHGARRMLQDQRIALVQVEAGMNPRNRRHIAIEAFKRFLEPRGYFLFGIYGQWPETPTRQPHLRCSDPVFVSEQAISIHTGS